jgi:WD40 repeat protein
VRRTTSTLPLTLVFVAHVHVGGSTAFAAQLSTGPVKEPTLEKSRECQASEAASQSGEIRDVLFPRAEIVLEGHKGPVRSAAFSSDGTQVVSGGDDGTARVWSVNGGGAQLQLPHSSPVTSVALSPAGTRVATTSKDGVRVWEIGAVPARAKLFRGDAPVSDVAFSPDGFRLVSAGRDGVARIWLVKGTGPTIRLRAAKGLNSVAFSPEIKGRRIIAGSDDGTALIWASDGAGEPLVLKGHGGPVRHVSFSVDETRAVTAGDDNIRIWRLDGSADPQSYALYGHDGLVVSAAFGPAPTGQSPRSIGEHTHWPGLPADVASAGKDGAACVWAWDGGYPISLEHSSGGVNSVAFSPDGTHIVTAGDNGQVLIWRMVRQH